MQRRPIDQCYFIGCLLLSLAQLPAALQAQSKPNLTEVSALRARRVVEAGIAALGGKEAITAIKSFTLIERRKGHDAFQNPTPGPPYVDYEAVETLRVDFTNARLWHDQMTTNPHFVYGTLTIVNQAQSYRADLWSRRATPLTAPTLDNYRGLFQKLPQFLLLDVLNERAASLRWLGKDETEGRPQEVVTYNDRNNRLIALYFDARTHLLTKYDYLFVDPAAGDTRSEFIYKDYHHVGQFKFPAGMLNRVGQHAEHQTRFEIRFDAPLTADLFTLPAKYEVVEPGAPRSVAPFTMTPIANDVYLIENVGGGYNVLVVAFDEFLLVAEAPEDRPQSGHSERVIATIKAALPGKPIRYLTFSHHHVDHGCGARAYIAEGTIIVTTPGNRRFVETLAKAPFTLKPDALARHPRSPVIELIEDKKRVISDARHRVELYDVGPYWHANEEVLVYLPKEKLLFEGDLFTSGFGVDVGPAQDHPILLAEKIRELGLDVQQIAGVHGRLRPLSDLHKAIEKRSRLSISPDSQRQ